MDTNGFPSGLTLQQGALLRKLAADVNVEKPQLYFEEARKHLSQVEDEAARSLDVNVRLARAIFSVFEETLRLWMSVPPAARPYLCAAMRYFASFQDEMNDFDSSLGFEDDVEVLNACLSLAGMSDYALDPAHYDPDGPNVAS